MTEVARTLEFAPSIEAMADRVVAAIHSTTPVFNAVHLRIERDAKDWAQIMGGPEVPLPASSSPLPRPCTPLLSLH